MSWGLQPPYCFLGEVRGQAEAVSWWQGNSKEHKHMAGIVLLQPHFAVQQTEAQVTEATGQGSQGPKEPGTQEG